jgi:hypothetical protein
MKTAEEAAPGYNACCKMYNSKCFRCLRGMFQALYIDVAKVDWDVADVVMAIHICFKCIFQMFYLDIAKVYLNVAYTCMLQAYVSSVFRCFIRMFVCVSSGCCICLQWFLNVFQAFS